MSEKRYYWLKLQKDFFKRNDIQVVESMPNGKDYVLFYLKLLCEATSEEGRLRFSETIPYSPEMLSTITKTNVDIVRSAIKVFKELGMIDVLDDGTYYMTEVEKMIGSETKWAQYKRGKKQEIGKIPIESKKSPIEIDIEKEIDKEIDINKEEKIPYKEIIDCLNKFAKTNYRHTSQVTKDKIKARWNDGFRLNDFETVIKNKCSEWMGTDMEKYLRPKTLFGNNFESYLNQKVSKENSNTDKVPDWYKNTGETEPDDELLKQVEEMKRGLNRET